MHRAAFAVVVVVRLRACLAVVQWVVESREVVVAAALTIAGIDVAVVVAVVEVVVLLQMAGRLPLQQIRGTPAAVVVSFALDLA
jgi:hypothetical protein